jgi:hypothetical protein
MPRLLSDFISTDSLMRQSHSVSLWRQLSNYLSVTPIGERFPDPSVAYLSVPLREVIWKWGLKFAQRNSSGAPLRSGTVFVSDFNDGCEGPQPSSSEYDAGVEAIWVSIGSSPISSRKGCLLLPGCLPHGVGTANLVASLCLCERSSLLTPRYIRTSGGFGPTCRDSAWLITSRSAFVIRSCCNRY